MTGMKSLARLCLAFFFSVTLWAAPKQVLVVDSYHADYAWSRDYHLAIQQVLGDKAVLTFFQMDTKRLPRELHEARAAEALRLIDSMKPDLVMVGDDAALRYVGARLAGSALPVVYLGINNNPRLYLNDHAANVTGVLERPLIRRNVSLMQRLVPGMKRALLLFDSDLTSDVIRAELFASQNTLRSGTVEIDMVRVTSYADWQRRVLEAPAQYQAVWAGLYQTLRDASGKVVPDNQVIEWTAQNSKLPLFGFWDFAVGAQRAAGGLVLSGRDQGRLAAGMAADILFRGRTPASLFPLSVDSGDLLFSRAALQRFGLVVPPSLQKQAHFIE